MQKELLALALVLAVARPWACSKPADGAPRSTTDDVGWVLEFRGVTDTDKVGRAVHRGAYQLDVPASGAFSSEAESELIEYPKRLGECDLVGSDGYVKSRLTLAGHREGNVLRLRESWPARTATLELRCNGITMKTPAPLDAGDHEFDLRLEEGATFEWKVPGPARRSAVVAYTLRRPTAQEAAIRRPKAKQPKLCKPSAPEVEAIHKALKSKDYDGAIARARDALGLPALRPNWDIRRDPSMKGEYEFGATNPDGSIRLGVHAFDNAPRLLGTLFHEAIGHSLSGAAFTGNDIPASFAAEEIVAYTMEQSAFDVLGITAFDRQIVSQQLTDLTAEFRRNYPTRVQELDARIQGAKSVAWEACHH